MELFNEEIKEFIKRELTSPAGEPDELLLSPEDVLKGMYALEQALVLSRGVEKLNAMEETFTKTLNDACFDRDIDADFFQKVEQFLGLFIYVKDEEYYDTVEGAGVKRPEEVVKQVTGIEIIPSEERAATINSKSIPDALEFLGYIDNRIATYIKQNYRDENEVARMDKETRLICQLYRMRNLSAHQLRNLSNYQRWVYFRKEMYLVLKIANKYVDEVLLKINKQQIEMKSNAREYLLNFIEENKIFNDQTTGFKFVFLEGEKEFNSKERKSLDSLIRKNEGTKLRLLGLAGMGKSTTLKHYAYIDAIEAINSNFMKNIPVYVELKEITFEKEDIILELLSNNNHLGCSKEVLKDALSNGFINIYLDGINEITLETRAKKNIVEQIERLIAEYPKTRLIVTDREINEDTLSQTSAEVYIIKKLEDNKIEEFIRGNSKTQEVVDKVLKIVFEKSDRGEKIKEIVRVPFKLNQLICLVDADKEIPETAEGFNKLFIDAIIDREISEKGTKEARNLRVFLKNILTRGSDLMEESEIRKIIVDTINEQYLSDVKSDAVLDQFVQLGILQLVKKDYAYYYKFENELLRINCKNNEAQEEQEKETKEEDLIEI